MEALQWVAKTYAELHPENVAKLLEQESPSEASKWLSLIPKEVAAGVLKRMTPFSAANCLEVMGVETASAIFEKIEIPLAICVLRKVKADFKENLIQAISNPLAKKFSELLKYPEDVAGSLMDSAVLTIPDDITVEEAERICKKFPNNIHYYLYIVDREQHLEGVLSLRDLTINDPKLRVASIMNANISKLFAEAGRREILEHPGWGEFHAIPVVDREKRFLGIIRYETYRLLESSMKMRAAQPNSAKEAGKALGELYWLGLTCLVHGVGSSLLLGKKDSEKKK